MCASIMQGVSDYGKSQDNTQCLYWEKPQDLANCEYIPATGRQEFQSTMFQMSWNCNVQNQGQAWRTNEHLSNDIKLILVHENMKEY